MGVTYKGVSAYAVQNLDPVEVRVVNNEVLPKVNGYTDGIGGTLGVYDGAYYYNNWYGYYYADAYDYQISDTWYAPAPTPADYVYYYTPVASNNYESNMEISGYTSTSASYYDWKDFEGDYDATPAYYYGYTYGEAYIFGAEV